MEPCEDQIALKNEILGYDRQAKFYRDKLLQLGGLTKLKLNRSNLQDKFSILIEKSRELEAILKALEEFSSLDGPTNEALKKRIAELKKKRLSLDVTFVE